MCKVIFRRQGPWSRFHRDSDGADQVRPPRIRSELAACASPSLPRRTMARAVTSPKFSAAGSTTPQRTRTPERANRPATQTKQRLERSVVNAAPCPNDATLRQPQRGDDRGGPTRKGAVQLRAAVRPAAPRAPREVGQHPATPGRARRDSREGALTAPRPRRSANATSGSLASRSAQRRRVCVAAGTRVRALRPMCPSSRSAAVPPAGTSMAGLK